MPIRILWNTDWFFCLINIPFLGRFSPGHNVFFNRLQVTNLQLSQGLQLCGSVFSQLSRVVLQLS